MKTKKKTKQKILDVPGETVMHETICEDLNL